MIGHSQALDGLGQLRLCEHTRSDCLYGNAAQVSTKLEGVHG
jgi:hypothetical protein